MTNPVEAIGLAIGLVQTLLTAAQELKEMCSVFDCTAQLQELENTLSTIKNLFLDVDAKDRELTYIGRDLIEKLKDAVYDADDLIDEFRTICQLREQKDAGLFEKVGNLFSKYFVNNNRSKEIKELTKRLAEIAKRHKDFGLSDVFDKTLVREETCSVSKTEIIGREEDKETVVNMVLSNDPHSNQNVSFLNIVGIGGLGKTSLAQLVFNDDKVVGAFSRRIWVCVSEVSENFNLQQILSMILEKQVFNLEKAQKEVREHLKGKRYLLVLDDVWIESPEEWSNLKPFLVSDVRGSKVIVTTRSKIVATSIRENPYVFELKGLSEENSWSLFKFMAFGKQTEDHEIHPDLVSIGKKIVKKCANVPLSIRVIASLLYGQDRDVWLSFRDSALGEISGRDEKRIMSTLMFSYYQLSPELKSCFSFCSIFPKDYIIQKQLLINLWLAQGYLVAANSRNAQSIEDVGEHCITILLNRCFFQDITRDQHGDVCSFKMHDLMHDLALKVAGNDTLILTPAGPNHPGKKVRHLSRQRGSSDLCLSNTLRTYVLLGNNDHYAIYADESLSDEVTSVVSNCKRLRVLSLPTFGIGCTLPDKVGKLLLLRYLDLSWNRWEMLPKSITELHNLQILILVGCRDLKELPNDINKLVNLRMLNMRICSTLKELPKDMSKLVNLRTLDISLCSRLKELPDDIIKLVNLRALNIRCCGVKYMPRGMHELTNLQRLSDFVVGGEDVKQIEGSKLLDLQPLKNLKGDLCIKVLNFSSDNMAHATKRAFILKDARLKKLSIECIHYPNNEFEFVQSKVHKMLVEDLCPNEDIYDISMVNYKGKKMPPWASLMEYSDMNGQQHMKSLSLFRCLKKLHLDNLPNVKYMEIENGAAWESRTFFPALEELQLISMPKLKGWWRGIRWREIEGGGGCLVNADGDDIHMQHAQSFLCFPRLHTLKIQGCKRMKYFPPCPYVKKLYLHEVNEALTFGMKGGASSSNMSTLLCMEELQINNARVMNTVLLTEFVGGAIQVQLKGDDEMKSMGTLREGFERVGCRLKHLTIEFCEKLDIEDEEEEGMPWKYLQTLSSLDLRYIPKMVKLPEGLRYLTSLQSLRVDGCSKLEEVGECISSLTSLQSLELYRTHKLKGLPECIGALTSLRGIEILSHQLESLPESMSQLTSLSTLDINGASVNILERCRKPDGEYWPRISHIPKIDIR